MEIYPFASYNNTHWHIYIHINVYTHTTSTTLEGNKLAHTTTEHTKSSPTLCVRIIIWTRGVCDFCINNISLVQYACVRMFELCVCVCVHIVWKIHARLNIHLCNTRFCLHLTWHFCSVCLGCSATQIEYARLCYTSGMPAIIAQKERQRERARECLSLDGSRVHSRSGKGEV